MKLFRKLLCHVGWCEIEPDPAPVNAVWWGFCKHCPNRFGGEYDPCYGLTRWRRR